MSDTFTIRNRRRQSDNGTHDNDDTRYFRRIHVITLLSRDTRAQQRPRDIGPSHVPSFPDPQRGSGVPPLITTTSSALDSKPVGYPSLMSEHQLQQGYVPSLQSMFINSGRTAPTGSQSLLFDQGNALLSPYYPSQYSYGHPVPLQQPPTSLYSSYPGPISSPESPRSVPQHPMGLSFHEDESHISRSAHSTGLNDPVRIELKNVSVPRDCLPKFMTIAALNTSLNRETFGLLLGKDKGHKFTVTTLLIPKQHSTSDSCTMDEEEVVIIFTQERSLITLGWVRLNTKIKDSGCVTHVRLLVFRSIHIPHSLVCLLVSGWKAD